MESVFDTIETSGRSDEVPPLFVAEDHASALGSATMATIRSAAASFGHEVLVVDDWEGDRFVYVEEINTPGFARVEIGWRAKGCSLSGTLDYVYAVGFWIELPPS